MSGPLHCADAIERLQDSLDERVPRLERSPWIAAHLAECPPCRGHASGLERIDGLGKRIARELRPPRESAAGSARFGACLAAAAGILLAVGLPLSLVLSGGPRLAEARHAALARGGEARSMDELEMFLRNRNAFFSGAAR